MQFHFFNIDFIFANPLFQINSDRVDKLHVKDVEELIKKSPNEFDLQFIR